MKMEITFKATIYNIYILIFILLYKYEIIQVTLVSNSFLKCEIIQEGKFQACTSGIVFFTK